MQSINLYSENKVNDYPIIQYTGMLKVLAVVCIVLLCIIVLTWWNTNKVESRRNILKMQLENTSVELLELSEDFMGEDASEQIQQQISTLIQARDQKINMLTALSRQNLSNSTGFSEYLTAISSQWTEEMWLTSFRINDAGENLKLIGKTNKATEIPEFIQRLTLEPVFTGKIFQSLILYEPKDSSILSFELTTNNITVGDDK